MDDSFFDRIRTDGPGTPLNKMVERPPTKYLKHGFINARDFIDNAWNDRDRVYSFDSDRGGRKVSFTLKEGPYKDYVVITWTVEADGNAQSADVYIVAEPWDGWGEIFPPPSMLCQVSVLQYRDGKPLPTGFLSWGIGHVDVEEYFGLSITPVFPR